MGEQRANLVKVKLMVDVCGYPVTGDIYEAEIFKDDNSVFVNIGGRRIKVKQHDYRIVKGRNINVDR